MGIFSLSPFRPLEKCIDISCSVDRFLVHKKWQSVRVKVLCGVGSLFVSAAVIALSRAIFLQMRSIFFVNRGCDRCFAWIEKDPKVFQIVTWSWLPLLPIANKELAIQAFQEAVKKGESEVEKFAHTYFTRCTNETKKAILLSDWFESFFRAKRKVELNDMKIQDQIPKSQNVDHQQWDSSNAIFQQYAKHYFKPKHALDFFVFFQQLADGLQDVDFMGELFAKNPLWIKKMFLVEFDSNGWMSTYLPSLGNFQRQGIIRSIELRRKKRDNAPYEILASLSSPINQSILFDKLFWKTMLVPIFSFISQKEGDKEKHLTQAWDSLWQGRHYDSTSRNHATALKELQEILGQACALDKTKGKEVFSLLKKQSSDLLL